MIDNKKQVRQIIISISEPFKNDFDYDYDDEDLSTLGANEVFEAIVISDNRIEARCRLMGYDAVKHIESGVIVQTTTNYPGKTLSEFKEASIKDLEQSINLLKEKSYQFNGGTDEYVDHLRFRLTQIKRDNTLDKLI